MPSAAAIGFPTVETRWEVHQCATVSGALKIDGLLAFCKAARPASFEVPPVHQNWKIYFRLQERSGWLGIHMDPTSARDGLTAKFSVQLRTRTTESVLASHDSEEPCECPTNICGTDSFVQARCITTNCDLNNDDCAVLKYTIKEYPDHYQTRNHTMNPAPFASDIISSLTSLFNDKETADIRFVIHSSHREAEPKEIYAHSKILSRIGWFKSFFGSNFKEGNLLSQLKAVEIHTSWEADDSDTDDEDVVEVANDSEADIISPALLEEETEATESDLCTPGSSWKIINVKNIKYRTLKAVLYHIYGGSIAFAPLKSTYKLQATSANSRVQSREEFNQLHAQPLIGMSSNVSKSLPTTSPKSVFKLCDYLDIQELAIPARQYIGKSLTVDNVIQELYSANSGDFALFGSIIQEYLEKNWDKVIYTHGFKQTMHTIFGQGEGAIVLKDMIIRQLKEASACDEEEWRE